MFPFLVVSGFFSVMMKTVFWCMSFISIYYFPWLILTAKFSNTSKYAIEIWSWRMFSWMVALLRGSRYVILAIPRWFTGSMVNGLIPQCYDISIDSYWSCFCHVSNSHQCCIQDPNQQWEHQHILHLRCYPVVSMMERWDYLPIFFRINYMFLLFLLQLC